ncbi:winged helix-turn-helix transcriptional regulator [Streptomyces sp. NPDC102360]|uniref:winged helix-turn-helix transcriptional regulator n=1 Tax=Streptomyces sp. NPDC102360 TaxID=3366160 RepID=UPI0037F76852
MGDVEGAAGSGRREVPGDGDVFARNGVPRATFETVTGRWAPLVMLALAERGRRFGVLRQRIQGVSEKMLAQTLRSLERDGLVRRRLSDGVPPQVEYALTPLGTAFAQRLRALADLCESSTQEVVAAREAYADGLAG